MNIVRPVQILFMIAMLLTGGGAFAASYDAIAVHDEQGLKGGDAGYGVGEGKTANAANDMAMKNCRTSGNGKCELAVTYQQCGAYASSREHSGTGTGETKDAAKSAALGQCGSGGCKIVVSDCVEN